MSDRKTCFKRVDYDLSSLQHYLDIGDIGLPDIQRPFVWSNAKVRDWFDSMHHGFPVGYFPFWENAQTNGIKRIGIDAKAHSTPSRLIVDDQQRLASPRSTPCSADLGLIFSGRNPHRLRCKALLFSRMDTPLFAAG
jgi:hypothetical protein